MVKKTEQGWEILCKCGKQFCDKGELFEIKAKARAIGFSMRMKKVGGYEWFCKNCKPQILD
jgi:hypothetical protein